MYKHTLEKIKDEDQEFLENNLREIFTKGEVCETLEKIFSSCCSDSIQPLMSAYNKYVTVRCMIFSIKFQQFSAFTDSRQFAANISGATTELESFFKDVESLFLSGEDTWELFHAARSAYLTRPKWPLNLGKEP